MVLWNLLFLMKRLEAIQKTCKNLVFINLKCVSTHFSVLKNVLFIDPMFVTLTMVNPKTVESPCFTWFT